MKEIIMAQREKRFLNFKLFMAYEDNNHTGYAGIGN